MPPFGLWTTTSTESARYVLSTRVPAQGHGIASLLRLELCDDVFPRIAHRALVSKVPINR